MELKKLHHSVVVADCGSFTRASSMLAVPQSVLSRHVAEVETWLDVRLLRRTGRGAEVTEAGQAIIPRLRALVADGNSIIEVARSLKGTPVGVVRVGCLRSIGPHLLTPLLTQAAELLPRVRIHVVEGLADHLDELLVAGRIDIGVLYDDRQVPGITDEVLFKPCHYLIGWDGDGVTDAPTVDFSCLTRVNLALPDPPNRLRFSLDRLAREHGFQLRVSIVVDAIDSMKDMATARVGHTVLPEYFVAPEIESGRLRASRIVNPEVIRPVVLGTSTLAPLSLAGEAVAALIRKLMAGLVRDGTLRDHAMICA